MDYREKQPLDRDLRRRQNGNTRPVGVGCVCPECYGDSLNAGPIRNPGRTRSHQRPIVDAIRCSREASGEFGSM